MLKIKKFYDSSVDFWKKFHFNLCECFINHKVLNNTQSCFYCNVLLASRIIGDVIKLKSLNILNYKILFTVIQYEIHM